MCEDDFDPFCEMLGDMAGMYPKTVVTMGQKAMFFRAVADHTLENVRGAFDAHLKDPMRGRFAPLPAAIIAQINGCVADDGRPGAEEAFAIALRSDDEAETIVWTAEMSSAWAIASPVQNSGDKVGARMAFKEAYARLIEEARRLRRPVKWAPSLGHDASRRDIALTTAHAAGLLTGPAPVLMIAPAATLDTVLDGDHVPAHVREVLAELRARLVLQRAAPTEAAIDRERTADLKAQSLRQVASFCAVLASGAA